MALRGGRVLRWLGALALLVLALALALGAGTYAYLQHPKFGTLPQDAAARGKQMRFLAARGFGGDVIRRVLAVIGQCYCLGGCFVGHVLMSTS